MSAEQVVADLIEAGEAVLAEYGKRGTSCPVEDHEEGTCPWAMLQAAIDKAKERKGENP
jgi:hypothetical protein